MIIGLLFSAAVDLALASLLSYFFNISLAAACVCMIIGRLRITVKPVERE